METSEILDKAADLLEEKGWHQGGFVDEGSGALCVVGALQVASGQCCRVKVRTSYRDRYQFELRGVFRDWLGWNCGLNPAPGECELTDYLGLAGMGAIPGWNDASGRTATEVIDALRHTAKLKRELENEQG